MPDPNRFEFCGAVPERAAVPDPNRVGFCGNVPERAEVPAALPDPKGVEVSGATDFVVPDPKGNPVCGTVGGKGFPVPDLKTGGNASSLSSYFRGFSANFSPRSLANRTRSRWLECDSPGFATAASTTFAASACADAALMKPRNTS